MSGDTEGVEQTPSERQADLDQMSAGYSDKPQEPTETPEPAVTPEPVIEPPKPVQLTAEEYQNLMRSSAEVAELRAAQQKMLDTVNGRIGRALEDIKSSGAAASVTIDDFPELNAEFPELAAMQVQGLNKVLGKMKGGTAANPADVQRLVAEQTSALRQELIDSALDGVMPDWSEEVKKPEFSEWMSKQTEEVKALSQSDKVRDAAKMLRLYSQRQKAPATPQVSTRQKRLEAAVIPRGTGGNATSAGNTDFDEMLAGYSG